MGLNVPQPPPLLHLYRDYNNHVMPNKDVSDVECLTDLDGETVEKLSDSVHHLEEQLANVKKHMVRLASQMLG